MARLKDLDTGSAAERRYVAKKFIYLESEEDVQILGERWFIDRGERIELLSAGGGNEDSGGCTRVIGRVEKDRATDIDAYGIVDRDALARAGKWDDFFETNPDRFAAARPFGAHVAVLQSWELENCLLHPEVIEEFLSDERGRTQRPLDRALEDLFDILCRVIPIVAGDLILNREGKSRYNDAFGLGQSVDVIYDSVRSRIEREVSEPAVRELDEFIERIVAFSDGMDHRSLGHWLAQVRMLDGKRMIRWLRHEYKLGDRDIRWHLARLTRDRGKISEMLDQKVLDLVA